jgi:hypothetical protein
MISKGLIKAKAIQEQLFQTAQQKDLSYTIVPGEEKKNYCKIMTNILIFSYGKPVTRGFIAEKIVKYAKKRRAHQYQSGLRTDRIPVSVEEATPLIEELIRNGYLKYIATQKRDKQHPNVPEEGTKFYNFDKLRIIECQESKYFKQKQQKVTQKEETIGKLSDKRCRALRQIYAQFTDKAPFTYEMVLNIPKFYKKMADDKTQTMSEDTRLYYRTAAQLSESRDLDFLNTWNSLIRNNYIVPFKVRTKDGTIKVRQGAYKVNMNYVRRCLSNVNL